MAWACSQCNALQEQLNAANTRIAELSAVPTPKPKLLIAKLKGGIFKRGDSIAADVREATPEEEAAYTAAQEAKASTDNVLEDPAPADDTKTE